MRNKPSTILLPLIVLACLGNLTACSSQVDLAKPTNPPNDPLPPYKKMISEALVRHEQIINPESYEPFSISGAQRVYSFHGWAWLVCLKGNHGGKPIYFGVFIQRQIIIDVRANIGMDLCPYQQYEPLSVNSSSPMINKLY